MYPTRSTRTTWLPSGTLRRVYLPSAVVVVKRLVLTRITRASASGSFVPCTVTCPVIVPCAPCARDGRALVTSSASATAPAARAFDHASRIFGPSWRVIDLNARVRRHYAEQHSDIRVFEEESAS